MVSDNDRLEYRQAVTDTVYFSLVFMLQQKHCGEVKYLVDTKTVINVKNKWSLFILSMKREK